MAPVALAAKLGATTKIGKFGKFWQRGFLTELAVDEGEKAGKREFGAISALRKSHPSRRARF